MRIKYVKAHLSWIKSSPVSLFFREPSDDGLGIVFIPSQQSSEQGIGCGFNHLCSDRAGGWLVLCFESIFPKPVDGRVTCRRSRGFRCQHSSSTSWGTAHSGPGDGQELTVHLTGMENLLYAKNLNLQSAECRDHTTDVLQSSWWDQGCSGSLRIEQCLSQGWHRAVQEHWESSSTCDKSLSFQGRERLPRRALVGVQQRQGVGSDGHGEGALGQLHVLLQIIPCSAPGILDFLQTWTGYSSQPSDPP